MAVKTKYIIEGENRTEHLFDQLDRDVRAFDKRMSGIAATGAAVGAALAVAFGGVKLVGVLREFGTLQASLETVTGSGKAAQEALGWIEPFAAKTPFQLEEVVSAFVKMKSLGLDPSEAALRSYGNTASAMGKSLDQFIEAVADASTSEFERLRDFGIKAKQQGDQVSLTFRGLTKTIGNNAEEIVAYLRRIGDVDFAGANDRRAATLDGALSNLEDSVTALVRAMGDAGLTVVITDGARAMSVLAGEMAKAVREGDDLLRVFRGLGQGIAQIAYGTDTQRLGDLEEQARSKQQLIARLQGLDSTPSRQRLIAREQDRLSQIEREIEGLKVVLPPAAFGGAPAAPANAPPGDTAGGGTSTGTSKSKKLTAFERDQIAFEKLARNNARIVRDFEKEWDKLMAEQAQGSAELTKEIRANQEDRLADLERSLLTEREAVQADLDERLRLLHVAEEQKLRSTMDYAELERRIREDAATQIGEIEKRELEAVTKDQEAQFERLTRAVQGWGDEATEAILNFATGAKASFSDMVESILRDIARIAIRKAIIDPLGNALFGGGDGDTGLLGSLFSGLMPTGSRATGGPAFRGQPLIVGEHGREMFVPNQDGKVMPMGGANVKVEVINATPAAVRVQPGEMIDGEQRIRVLIGEAVAEEIGRGRLDRTMGEAFGARRTGVNR